MHHGGGGGGRQREYIKCRVEKASPLADWEHCWRLARLSGLGPENTFLFKLLHQTLPTQERVARTKPSTSPNCKVQGCQGEMDNLAHALLFCPTNDDVGKNLLELHKGLIPGIEAEAALRLELHVDQDLELPLVWYIATVLHSVWKAQRHKNIVARLEEFAASMFL